jgi:L,D-peptidoglycan transpeptidase YkuD (ErfK/YbiS/YcfS/YnhG family)
MTFPIREQAVRLVRSLAACPGARMEECRQVVLVVNSDAASCEAAIYVLECISGQWRVVSGPVSGNIGRNGFAPPGGKREGDGRTPSGIFGLGTAFGYPPAVDTGMAYRQSGEDDFWVNDVGSPDYNRWVKGARDGTSVERMKRDDDLYKYGIVVEYNTDPVVRGLGSAIFLHVWVGAGAPTDGCVSMSEEAILLVLAWLDASAKPVAVMGTEGHLAAIG